VALNKQLRQRGIDFTILRSAEMNLSPEGAGDVRPTALRKLELVLGSRMGVLVSAAGIGTVSKSEQ
jgi:hypothetical protein